MQKSVLRWAEARPAAGGLCALLVALAGCGDDVAGDIATGTGGLTATGGGDADDDDDAASGGDSGDGNPADGDDDDDDDADDGSDDGGMLGEPCDGLDNDGDGVVDELCACEDGEVQDCFAGPPEDALDCRQTTQTCEQTGGSETPATWGACGGLCEGSTLTLDDPAMFRIWGAAEGDRFSLAHGGGFRDIDGDGEMDFTGSSVAGDAASPDVGAAYGLFGGPCLQRSVMDLATLPLTGEMNEDGHGGFIVDTANGRMTTMADVNGDGFGDVLVADSGSTIGAVFGTTNPPALVEVATPDGMDAVRFTGGGGSNGTAGSHTSTDYDGDGFDDLFLSASNSQPACPCSSNGMSVWWGGSDLSATVALDFTVPIGIGHVGVATQHNFAVAGSFGDFNNDGFADLVGGNGAANDAFVIPYRTAVIFGTPTRTFPSTMIGGDGTTGFTLEGGAGRGAHPGHQAGDFDGDGVDDLLTYASSAPFQLHLLYGHAGSFAPTLNVSSLGAEGLVLETDGTLAESGLHGGPNVGFGDIDADGYDDLVFGLADPEIGGAVIVWGRPGATGSLTVDTAPDVTVITGATDLGPTQRFAIEDLDGDGLGDVVIGAHNADGPSGVDTGAGLVKFGACLAGEHNPTLILGQDGPDQLGGDPGQETFAGGRGDDVIDTGGGADVAYGGQGDDTIVVDDLDFMRVDGGLGYDTLIVDAAGSLDLTTIGRARILELEHFELRDGAQQLRLNTGDASGLSTTRELTIDADASDTVTLVGPWQVQAGPAGYDVYIHGALSVTVAQVATTVLEP